MRLFGIRSNHFNHKGRAKLFLVDEKRFFQIIVLPEFPTNFWQAFFLFKKVCNSNLLVLPVYLFGKIYEIRINFETNPDNDRVSKM